MVQVLDYILLLLTVSKSCLQMKKLFNFTYMNCILADS